MSSVTLPNGMVIPNAAPGMTAEKYMEIVKAGNPALYRSILSQVPTTPLEPTTLESVGRGMKDPYVGARQMLPEAAGGYSPDQNVEAMEEMRRYEAGAGPGIDWGRMGGNVATLAPLGGPGGAAQGLIGRTVAGGAMAGVGGAMMPAEDTQQRVANAGLAALTGGAISGVAPVMTRGAGKVLGAGRTLARTALSPAKLLQRVTVELDEAAKAQGMTMKDLGGKITSAMKREAVKALRSGEDYDPAALVRKARAEKFGFVDDAEMTPGQAARDPKMWSQESRLADLDDAGEPLQARYKAQREQIENTMQRFRNTWGAGREVGEFEAGEAMESAAKSEAARLQAGVRAAYQKAEAAAPAVRASKTRFASKVGPIVRDFEDFIPAGVRRRLDELVAGEREFTATEAMKLDKLITDTLPSNPWAKTERMAARQLQESIIDALDDAGSRAGEYAGLYKQAKGVAAKRFKAIGKSNEVTAKLITESLAPERVVSMAMRGPVRQVDNLMRFVGNQPEAKEQLQAAVLSKITDAAGGEDFVQAGYNKVIKQIGKNRLTLLFGGDGARELMDFGELARDLLKAPPGNTINRSKTAPTIANMLMNLMQSRLPGGNVLAGLRQVGVDAAQKRATARVVSEVLTPPGPPIAPNVLAPYEPAVRALAPAVGAAVGVQNTP